MPLSLATPMPTAQGDLSVIPMLIWQSDAIVLALLSGAALTLAGAAGTSWVLLAAAGAGVVMAPMARSRLRGVREGQEPPHEQPRHLEPSGPCRRARAGARGRTPPVEPQRAL